MPEVDLTGRTAADRRAGLEAALIDLFGPRAGVSVATPEMYATELYPEECAWLAGVSDRRARDFRAGRACARVALAGLRQRPTALPIGADRAPRWPMGLVGSISHCDSFCCAIAAPETEFRGLGVDLECKELDWDRELAELICRPEERLHLTSLPGDRSNWVKTLFSIKEAVFKCYAPLAGGFLDFRDVGLQLHPAGAPQAGGTYAIHFAATHTASARTLEAIQGGWGWLGGLVFSGAWLSTSRSYPEESAQVTRPLAATPHPER